MKLTTLIFEGADGKKIEYNFSNNLEGFITPENVEEYALKKSLSIAFFGIKNQDDLLLELPSVMRLTYVLDDQVYSIVRNFEISAGRTIEKARLINEKGEKLASNVESVNEVVSDLVGLDRLTFEKLIVLDRNIVESLICCEQSIDLILSEHVRKLTSAIEIKENINRLRNRETQASKILETLKPVTRKEIENIEKKVSKLNLSLKRIKEDKEQTQKAIQLANIYENNQGVSLQIRNKLDDIMHKNAEEIEQLKKRLEKHNEGAAVFEKHSAYEKHIKLIDKKRLEYTKIQESIKGSQSTIEKGEAQIKKLSDDFVMESRRLEEFEKVLSDYIVGSAKGPKEIGLDKIVEGYYAKYIEGIDDVFIREKKLEEAIQAIQGQIWDLKKKRSVIAVNPDYKIAVEDGAIIEETADKTRQNIAASERRIERLLRERAELVENNNVNVKEINHIKEEMNQLHKKICGDFPTQKDSINASVYRNQNLYSKYLLATNLEKEIISLAKKIDLVDKSNKDYADKLLLLINKRTEIVNHREKLGLRLQLLNEKLTEYLSYNKLREITFETEYGSHCPICDNFVAVKKELPLRDTRALDDQIQAVMTELDKDTHAIIEAENTLGQYEAAIAVSSQYIEALEEQKQVKESQLQKILSEFNFQAIEDLALAMHEELGRSKKVMLLSDEFKVAEGELKKREARHNQILERIKLIDLEALPYERLILAKLVEQEKRDVAKYASVTKLLEQRSALDILKKLQVIDKEIATIDQDIYELEQKLKALEKQNAECKGIIADYHARRAPLNYKGQEYTYTEIAGKAFAELLLSLIGEINKTKSAKNKIKVRIQAIRKVVDENINKIAEDEKALLVLQTQIDAANEYISYLFTDFDLVKFKEVEERAGQILLSEADEKEIKNRIYNYEKEVTSLQDRLGQSEYCLIENVKYFEAKAENEIKLKELEKTEKELLIDLGKSNNTYEENSKNYYEAIQYNKVLTSIQSRLLKYDEVAESIAGDELKNEELAKSFIEKVAAVVGNMTEGKATIKQGENNQLLLVDGKKTFKVKDAFEKGYDSLLNFAVSYAFGDIVRSLIGAEFTFAYKLMQNELVAKKIEPLARFSRDTDIMILPEDFALYFQVISSM